MTIPVEQVVCDYAYVFLRQDERNVGYDRSPTWLVSDVFFCSRCLHYRRVDVEKRVPKGDGGYYVERLK